MASSRIIRHASVSDIESILNVIDAAKGIMRASGNMHQWADGYPSSDVILHDIERGGGHVIEESPGSCLARNGEATDLEGRRIVAYFAFLPSPEPTYSEIFDGAWLDGTLPYHVIHRIASYPDAHGIFNEIIEYAALKDSNLRVDTHPDNKIMLRLLAENGFTYCGIIYLASGDLRLAYQRLLTK